LNSELLERLSYYISDCQLPIADCAATQAV
jgi:hypothetical protein